MIVYSKQRTVQSVRIEQGAVRIDLEFGYLQGGDDFTVSYVVDDSNDTIDIDITDVVRAYPSGEFTAKQYDDHGVLIDDRLSVDWTTGGLTDPARDFIPETTYEVVAAGVVPAGAVVTLPSMILAGGKIVFEAFGYTGFYTALVNGQIVVINNNTIPQNAARIVVRIGSIVYSAQLNEQDECKDYVQLRWVSRYGNVKQFTWERRDLKEATDDTLRLMDINTPFNVHKGAMRSLTARLGNLTAYDHWYYADIVTSDKVEMLMPDNVWRQVEVTTKDVTTPNTDNGEPKELEIDINYAAYDTI